MVCIPMFDGTVCTLAVRQHVDINANNMTTKLREFLSLSLVVDTSSYVTSYAVNFVFFNHGKIRFIFIDKFCGNLIL